MAVKNFAVGLAIAIMLPFAVHYGVITFSPAAKYYNCSKKDFVKLHGGKELPEEKAGENRFWMDKDKSAVEAPKTLTAEETAFRAKLEAEYDEGHKAFNKHLFFVAVPLGILVIAVGLIVLVPGIDSGLMFGGLLTLMYGYFTYWSDLPVAVRFVSLVGGLALFIIIGVIKHGKDNKT